jgi:hypothetical protein
LLAAVVKLRPAFENLGVPSHHGYKVVEIVGNAPHQQLSRLDAVVQQDFPTGVCGLGRALLGLVDWLMEGVDSRFPIAVLSTREGTGGLR